MFHSASELFRDFTSPPILTGSTITWPVTEAVDENIVKELAMGGMGVTLLRRSEAEDVVRQGAGVIWEPGEIQVPLCLTWLSRRGDDRLISSAAAHIAAIWR